MLNYFTSGSVKLKDGESFNIKVKGFGVLFMTDGATLKTTIVICGFNEHYSEIVSSDSKTTYFLSPYEGKGIIIKPIIPYNGDRYIKITCQSITSIDVSYVYMSI